MRRKQKRLLQAVGLALAALVFLPNVGLWALYRERQLEPSGREGGGGGGAGGARGAAAEAPPGREAARGEAQLPKKSSTQEVTLTVLEQVPHQISDRFLSSLIWFQDVFITRCTDRFLTFPKLSTWISNMTELVEAWLAFYEKK